MAEFGYWKADNNIEGDFLGVGVSLAGGVGGLAALTYGGYFSFVVGWGGAGAWAVVFVYFSHDSDFYLDMWSNDSQFVALFTTAETYAKLLMMGCDCEQEAMDAYVELQVYILQKKYGDDWRKHAQTSLLKYYDEMVKRRQPLTGGNGSDEIPEPPMDISIT